MKTANRYAHVFPEIPPSEWVNLGGDLTAIQKKVGEIDAYIESKFRFFLQTECKLGQSVKEYADIFELISDDFWEIASTALAHGYCGKIYTAIVAENAEPNLN